MMTNQEKFDKARDRIQCILDSKYRELSDLVLKKISLNDSIESIDFRAMNKKANNEINEYEALLIQKEEREMCLAMLIDEINVSGAVINAMQIGIERIKAGVVDFEVSSTYDDDDVSEDIEAYSNKVSKKKKIFGR